ncbi:alanine racemase [Arthrobacter sp. JSM 101049]|uniref:alanine racemase n=1 Tax=Arthrobacter sp. JSM 101049 TaxID=929097 RepID=UPI0035668942
MTADANRRVLPASLPTSIQTPEVLVDLDILHRNIDALGRVVSARGQRLRPHAKTHKSPQIAAMQLAAGACGLTVATVGEAEVFANAGVDDLFIAYPLWVSEPMAPRLAALARRVTLRIGVDSVEGARNIVARLGPDAAALAVMIELDSGHHRSGTVPEHALEIARTARQGGLHVAGIFTFPGHSYEPGASAGAVQDESRVLDEAARSLRAAGFTDLELSGGSTPTAHTTAAGAATEVRPGVYVFNDAQQLEMGHCAVADIALTVASTVVSRRPHPDGGGRVVLDAGSKVLGSDRPAWASGFARIRGCPEARVTALSEHHGTVEFPAGGHLPGLGDILQVIPNHVCLVPNLVDAVTVVQREDSGAEAEGTYRIVDRWTVAARGQNS